MQGRVPKDIGLCRGPPILSRDESGQGEEMTIVKDRVRVPKYLCWRHSHLEQTYQCGYHRLITSGCSFTSSTLYLRGAASWPGFVRDRCGIDLAIDMSFPGAGNRYISDSIRYAADELCRDADTQDILVVVMWSGLDRAERIENIDHHTQIQQYRYPILGRTGYKRISDCDPQALTEQMRQDATQQSFELITGTLSWLQERGIASVFTSYANLLYPPFLPKRDTTHHWQDYLDQDRIDQLQAISWVPNQGLDYLYEYSFVHDYLETGDHFHPPERAIQEWTDHVLLPTIASQHLISPRSTPN